ncbi:serine hydrolase [Pediococcus damnosus]|uniref:serine hydrolase domain-containing protein n=1 Tax=Pediococcus damnosus TaxID=51663 RepID=UPI000C1C8FA9|nr:serine hydrolase [Pediococcus damnosus]PIO80955.1 serine hydrolase [Pediococcus damnosus]
MTENKFTKMKNEIDAIIDRGDVYGASFSFINETKIDSFYHGFQGKDIFAERLDPSMIYDVSSLTKAVATTTRVFQLLAVHELGLKDSVTAYLPGFLHPEVTIENLLLHNSGLPADVDNLHSLTGAELVKKIYEDPLVSKPGEKTIYSDLGFILLGLIIRTLNGSIDRSVQDHIWYPLAMTNTGYNLNRPKSRFVPTEVDPQRGQIQGQVHDYKALLLNGESGHSGLFSTLSDLTVFTEMMISRGKYQKKEILDPNLFDLMASYDENGRTLGWRRLNHKEQYVQTGYTGTILAFDPVKKQGFVCLTNRIYPTRDDKRWNQDRDRLLKMFFEN